MMLTRAIRDYSKYKSQPNNNVNWFEIMFQTNQLSINTIKEFPLSQQEVLKENQDTALSFFWEYQQFIEDHPDLQRYYYISYYKAKQQCFDYALNLGKNKCIDWEFHIVEWLRVCYNASNDKEIEFFLKQSQINPENEIKRTIFYDDKQANVREDFKEELAHLYFEPLLDWFLKRYDLLTALKILKIIRRLTWNKDKEKNGSSDIFPWKLSIFSFILFSCFYFLHFNKSDLLIWTNKEFIPFKDWSFFVYVESLVCIITIVLFMFFLIDFISKRKTTLYFKLLIPRLLGGIFIGYFPILIGEEVWSFVKEVNAFEGFFIVILSSVFCLYYLFTELNNVVKDIRVAFFRSIRIWLIGLIESFLIGIFIQDLFARAFVKTLTNYSLIMPNGLLGGNIYPKVLLIYFPLALFIGIFVQLIWEDKPITHPL